MKVQNNLEKILLSKQVQLQKYQKPEITANWVEWCDAELWTGGRNFLPKFWILPQNRGPG